MRIIGGHDYYDAGLAYGIDPQVVFVRDKEPNVPVTGSGLRGTYNYVSFGSQPRRTWDTYSNLIQVKRYRLMATPAIVWLAGKRYGGVRIQDRTADGPPMADSFFWDHGKFLDWLSQVKVDPPSRERKKWHYDESRSGFEILQDHFESPATDQEVALLHERRWAVVVSSHDEATHNWRGWKKEEWRVNRTGLREIGFAGRVDVTTAWQELSMFLGMQPRPMVQILDQVVKRDKAGFDRFSFKKGKDT